MLAGDSVHLVWRQQAILILSLYILNCQIHYEKRFRLINPGGGGGAKCYLAVQKLMLTQICLLQFVNSSSHSICIINRLNIAKI